MTALDYAHLFEAEVRPRRSLPARARRAAVFVVWAGLFMIRPRLALDIIRERR